MRDDTDDPAESDLPDQSASGDATTTVHHEWRQSDQPSVTIVEAVAAATDRPTTDLPPLHGTVDTDALDSLLDGQSPSVTVSFRYSETTVSVTGNGNIQIHLDGVSGEDDG